MTDRAKFRRWLYRTTDPLVRFMGEVPGSRYFFASMVLLASVKLATTDEQRLADETGVSLDLVRVVGRHCRKYRIWLGTRIRADWMDKEQGDFAFMLDVMVALGDIIRVAPEKAVEKRRTVRQQRKDAGLCPSCGKAREGNRLVCPRCIASVKASTQRTKDRRGQLTELKSVDPLYTVERA